MEQFSLEKYLENPSRKVVTREGIPIRIVCWDSPNKGFPIVGFIDDNSSIFVWDKYGYALSGHRKSNRDLFFADDEEKLTEFEKELEMMMVSFSNSNVGSDIRTEMPKDKLHNYAHKLRDLARKELKTNYYTKVIDDKMVFKSELHEQSLQTASSLCRPPTRAPHLRPPP
jgi:hypothetical protein